MKIDLHCHTKKTKSGDPVTRNVTTALFSEKIKNAGVKIVGITNHNLFDFKQYQELKAAVIDECQVWPGVELNIMSDFTMKQWHIVIVSNPDTVSDFDRVLTELTSGFSPETCMLKIEDVVNAFSSIDCFYIPHYHKTPQITEEDSKKLLELVGDSYKILNETSDVRSLGVFANHSHRVIVGSDVKDWATYEDCTFSELRLPVESFSQLYMLAKRDPLIVNTLLNKNNSRNLTVKIENSEPVNLVLYNEVNIIFGSKGTGKSEILSALQTQFEEQAYICSSYIASEKEEEFKKLLSTDNMRRHVGKVGSVACDNELLEIKNWKDENPVPISDYVQWCKTKDVGTNRQRMKITLASTSLEPDSKLYLETANDLINIKKSINVLNRVDVSKYLVKAKNEQLQSLHIELVDAASVEFRKRLIDYYATKLSKEGIESIKFLVDKKTDAKSMPGTPGFSAFAINRLKLRRNAQTILDNVTEKETKEKEPIGSLEGKGNVYVQSVYRMCSKDSSTKEFYGKTKTDLMDALKKLSKVKDAFSSTDAYIAATTFNVAANKAGINSTEHFLGLSKQVVLDNNQLYKPSSGEKAILIMQKALKVNAAVYIFDEPELGMGNSYIDENIRLKLTALGKSQKIVIVATHNANIAVRTLPYATIYRDYDNGTYKTYLGNAFINQLVNIDDKKDVKNWKDTSLKVLEGGKEAFYERKDIYESRKN